MPESLVRNFQTFGARRTLSSPLPRSKPKRPANEREQHSEDQDKYEDLADLFELRPPLSLYLSHQSPKMSRSSLLWLISSNIPKFPRPLDESAFPGSPFLLGQ
jgi:hypothetical protein